MSLAKNCRECRQRMALRRHYYEDRIRERPLFVLAKVSPTCLLCVRKQTQAFVERTMGKIINNSRIFRVELDVTSFKRKELCVTLSRDGKEITIEGHHQEESNQCGSIERHFIRKYAIPADVDQTTIKSILSDCGILCVEGKKRLVSPRIVEVEDSVPKTKTADRSRSGSE